MRRVILSECEGSSQIEHRPFATLRMTQRKSTMSIYDEILHKIKLSQIIGKDVKLKLNGNEFLGCCPFHKEKTPSFRVNDQKGLYYCFGCQAKGNAFTYLNTKMPKKETLELLAKLAGVKLEPLKKQKPLILSQLHLYRQTADFFKQNLTQEMVDYLTNRGITKQSIDTYEIGFCPLGDELFQYVSRTFSQDMLDKSELFTGKKCRFRGRLMFPIKNYKGHVIAFGGRAMDKVSKAKYINSKETEIFKKSEVLYGFFETDKKKSLLITEGYPDVLKVNQVGQFGAVAPLGTSFSKEQAEQIWQYDERPLVCFDGDKAGQTAAYRLIEKMTPHLNAQKSFAFLDLPEGEDADSFSDELKTLTPIPFADKLFEKIGLNKNLSLPEHQAFVREEILRITGQQQNKALAKSFAQYLLSKLWNVTRNNKKHEKHHYNLPPLSKTHHLKILSSIMLATLLKYPRLLDDIQEYLGRIQFEDPVFEQLKNQLLERYFDETTQIKPDILDIEKLIAYAPFLDNKHIDEEVNIKDIWMDIYAQYLIHTTQHAQTWQELQSTKKKLIVEE